MRPELARLQRIEQQLLSPNSGDAAAWNVQLLIDTDLQADTETQRLLYQGIYLAGQRQLRSELAAIHQRLYGTGRESWVRSAAAGLRAFLTRRLGRRPNG